MPKVSQVSRVSVAVRTRRAYFDCKFGQLHVRTAFPTTGGFDEQVTLFCLHPIDASSRVFSRVLPQLADVRSVYAPDLPGCGESDSSPERSVADAAAAVADLARDLRLRQIDVVGVQYGAEAAIELAIERPDLVRRLVVIGAPSTDRSSLPKQQRLAIDGIGAAGQPVGTMLEGLTKRIDAFLRGRS
ncbi:MAG TPA: alpha/beta hydrolase [Steroidobacteraceae bacterium]|nr:alpha/beta hydrolase [Steroidobacteraceae bacterium]